MINPPFFVVDTNVLISAHLLERSVSARAFSKAFSLGIIVRSELTLIEFADTFLRPKFDKYIPREDRLILIDQFKQNSLLVFAKRLVNVCRDPDDDIILDLALAANATCLISGDEDLLVLNPFRGIPILSPSNFLSRF